jgi:hypothetical protein
LIDVGILLDVAVKGAGARQPSMAELVRLRDMLFDEIVQTSVMEA